MLQKHFCGERCRGDSHFLIMRSAEQELAPGAHIRSQPGITLAQTQAWFEAEPGLSLSTGATRKALRLGQSFKKKALLAAEQVWPDVATRRKLWRAARESLRPAAV